VRVVVVNDNPVFRLGVRAALATNAMVRLVGEAANGTGVVHLVRSVRPDVVLLDVPLPNCDGPAVIGELAAHAAVVMLSSASESETVARAIESGATGYLVHGGYDPGQLVDAIIDAAHGLPCASPAATTAMVQAVRCRSPLAGDREASAVGGLSSRERDVMRLVAEGMTNDEVGRRLGLTEKTVKNHLQSVYAKLDVHNRAAALSVWLGAAAGHDPTPTDRGNG